MSLLPNISHDFGLRALNDFLLDRILPTNVVNGILNMTVLVLKKNVFVFNSECFLQTSGTAIRYEDGSDVRLHCYVYVRT